MEKVMEKDMVETEEQLAVKTAWKDENCNILLDAIPGSGKTTTLLSVLGICEYKTLFLSFNSSIKKEIQSKIENAGFKHGKALTMHSLGLSSVKTKWSRVVVNKNLKYDLIKKLRDNNKKLFKMFSWENQMKLSYVLLDLYDASRIFYTTNLNELKKCLIEQGKTIFEPKPLKQLFQELLDMRQEAYSKKSIEIDFNDMLFLPVYFDLRIPIDPIYLLIDECQDLNLLQHQLIENLIRQGDVRKFMSVGDFRQAIYGFSGAYSGSFKKFLEYPDTKEMKLSYCFRCTREIVNEVNEVYNVVHSPDWKEDGVKSQRVCDFSDIKVGSSTMVVCRNTAPLIDAFFYLLSTGKKCFIEGDDVIGGIRSFLGPYKSLPIWKAFEDIDFKIGELLLDDLRKEEVQKNLYLIKDNRVLFKKLVDNFNAKNDTVKNLLFRLETLLKDNKGGIKLCTIHKSKGLEADYVYILNENLIPSKFSTSPEQLKQEENLRYVARSRAKKELYYLDVEV